VLKFFLWFSPNLDFFEQIMVKVSNIKFHKNLSSGGQADTCGQVGADLINVDKQMGHDKAIRHFWQLMQIHLKKSGWHI